MLGLSIGNSIRIRTRVRGNVTRHRYPNLLQCQFIDIAMNKENLDVILKATNISFPLQIG